MTDRKRFVLSAFLMNAPSHISHGMWRHPQSRWQDFNDLKHWTHVAKVLEHGRFDTLFLADVMGVYAPYRGSTDIFVEQGIQIPNNDPSILLAALVSATEHLGLTFTSSILQDHPFHFARRISTLDHLSGGRVGWNIVTNALDSAARNFGQERMEEHDERYRWAGEYMEVVYKLWEASWTDDAVERARDGHYADPRKVRPIHHVGERYRVRGPHLSEPSPQRTPVLFQAGASGAGRAFAARHAEAIFTPTRTLDEHRNVTTTIRALARANGRRDDDILFLPGMFCIVGSTEEEALRKCRDHDAHMCVEGYLAHVGGAMGIDLATTSPDMPLTDLKVQGVQSMIDTLLATSSSMPTVADLIRTTATANRVVGTPDQIADLLESWQAVGIDGINLGAIMMPGSLEDFVDQVVPELQRRDMVQRDYAPGTLREKLFRGRDARLPERHPGGAMRQASIPEVEPAPL